MTDHAPRTTFEPWSPDTAMQRRRGEGHANRTGHALAGFWRTESAGDGSFPLSTLVLTCCGPDAGAVMPGDSQSGTPSPVIGTEDDRQSADPMDAVPVIDEDADDARREDAAEAAELAAEAEPFEILPNLAALLALRDEETERPTPDTRPEVCDCGHAPSREPGSFAVGYARLMGNNAVVCYVCTDALQRFDWQETAPGGKFGAYVSTDGRRIMTWTGGELARVTEHGTSRAGFHGSTLHYWSAVDSAGNGWHGRNGGPGMHVTMTRRKGNR